MSKNLYFGFSEEKKKTSLQNFNKIKKLLRGKFFCAASKI
jgi:hypothetical protein